MSDDLETHLNRSVSERVTVASAPSRIKSSLSVCHNTGHFKPCMTDNYLHINARMADYIRTHLPQALSPGVAEFCGGLRGEKALARLRSKQTNVFSHA